MHPPRRAVLLPFLLLLGWIARPALPRALAADAPPAPPPAPATPTAPAPDAPPPTVVESPGDLGIDVVGARPLFGPDAALALRRTPGDAEILDRTEEVRFKASFSLQDALRGRPAVNLREEDAIGLTPNIGFRGLNPDRSERLLILEDGVPAGLAPYIENAAYYVPPFERMARIEVLKGSGQILYGPHTVGAVLNLVTPEIPLGPTASLRTLGGSHGTFLGYAEGGGTWGRLGLLATVLAKSGDGYKDDSDYELQDVTVKARWTFDERTNLTAKVNWYRAESHQTYLGLTTGLFAEDPFENIAPQDLLSVDWLAGQLTLRHAFSPRAQLLVNAYVSDATRDWNRQDFTRNVGFAPPPANTVETVGDPSVDGGAVYLRSSFGSRDRDFLKWGVEPRLTLQWTFLGRPADLEVGARFHTEEMVDERNNRATYVSDPVLRDRDVRGVDAFASWAQARLPVAACLDVIAGMRLEDFEATRHVTRAAGVDVDVEGDAHTTEWIPGLGFAWRVGDQTVFGGVHRGYAPPRTSQAIDSAGTDVELDPELSWNYELGVRSRPCAWVQGSATAFYLDFSNIVVPDNESGGASTESTNAGAVEIYGLELEGSVDLVSWWRGAPCGAALSPCVSRLWLDLAYTYTHTENVTRDGLFRGNELPYAPEHLGSIGLRWEAPSGLDVGAYVTYTGEQYADQAETREPNAEGTRGLLEDRWVCDLVVGYAVPRTAVRVQGALRNVFDETYVASRAPEGIFPGAPRHWFLEVEIDF